MNRIRPVTLAIACAFALPAIAGPETAVVIEEHVVHPHGLIAEAAGARATAEAWRDWADELRASVGTTYGHRMALAKPVKGAPYSAELATESNRTLADGNVISRKTGGRVYRDGEGRTRQETVVNGKARSIQIVDPVEGRSVMLLPGSRKAVTLPRHDLAHEMKDVQVFRLGDREVRIDNGKLSVDGKAVASGKVELRVNGKEIRVEGGRVWIDGREVTGGPRAELPPLEAGKTGDGPALHEEVHVRVIRAGDGESREIAIGVPPVPPVPPVPAVPPPPPAGGPVAMGIDGALARAKATTTSLGSREFDGVRAEGKSTQRTIPAGAIGNRNPILVTTETWYSPELQVTVYARTVDPRHGETLYRLANIRRGEPAADLFKVPADYAPSGKRSKG